MVEDLSVQACRTAINELLSQRVDGLLINVSLCAEDSHAIEQVCGEVPALFLDVDPDSDVSSILFDPYEGARQGVEHVVALGHRDIALITGPLVSISARLRYQGWLTTLAERQLKPCSVLHGDWSAASGYQLAGQILSLPKHPTAILVANDQMALGVLRALQEYGLQIPVQMSVVEYDDTEDSAYYYPPLTTIKQDFRMLGQESVKRLVQCLEDRHVSHAGSLRLTTSLVQRHTTAAMNQEKVSLHTLSQELLRAFPAAY